MTNWKKIMSIDKDQEIHRLREWIEYLADYHATIPKTLDNMILNALEGKTVKEYERKK